MQIFSTCLLQISFSLDFYYFKDLGLSSKVNKKVTVRKVVVVLKKLFKPQILRCIMAVTSLSTRTYLRERLLKYQQIVVRKF